MTRTCIKIGWYKFALRPGITLDQAALSLSTLLGMVDISEKDTFLILENQVDMTLYEAYCITKAQYEEGKAIQEKKEENSDA